MKQARAIEFYAPSVAAPDYVMAEVEIPIRSGPLAGLSGTGVRIRANRERVEELYATMPSASYEARPGGRRYPSFLRGSWPGEVNLVKRRIVAEFRRFARLDKPRR